jgi:hypothetical protein
MPIDFQQIYTKVHDIGQNAQARKETLDRQRERAWELLELHSTDLDSLREKVERMAREADPNLRCASPRTEILLTRQSVDPTSEAATLVAIDGSQIAPDRHEALTYGLINIGAVSMRVNSAAAPEVFTESELLFDDELRNKDGSLLDEGGIALKRDARERAKLLELARRFQGPVVALTDGPVELWGAKDPANAGTYQKFLQQYLDDLDKLNSLGVILGGYVDKPAADLVVRLLEISMATDDDLKKLREYHPLLGVTDRWLFGRLLKPGERSAVFAMQSSSRVRYSGARAIHFFYLNVSLTDHPSIARVELPQWVADDPQKFGPLHTILVRQSSLLGARPYPYILHRAHETAKVSFDEKEQVELLLTLELRKQGIEMDTQSGKQSVKKQAEIKGSYKR